MPDRSSEDHYLISHRADHEGRAGHRRHGDAIRSGVVKPIRKAVFPAAGLGTRFLPATKAIPKEMLPLVDKPTIQYGVEEAVGAGVTDIILVTAEGKEAMASHFGVSADLEQLLESRGKHEFLRQIREVSGLARVSTVLQ
jgi:UTP--glucose-1-phosphate uridylyltransferase